jgi:thioredoxin reductase (NADPH)
VDAEDRRARAWLADLEIEDPAGPVVLLGGDRFLVNPTNEELAAAAGLRAQPAVVGRTFDLIVVGAGPGGLAASVYGAAGGMTTCLLDAVAVGGQAATSGRIENYLGFPAGVSGAELAERAHLQAGKFGVAMMVPCRAVRIDERDGFHVVTTEGGEELMAGIVILALGVQYRRLPIPRLAEYEGAGVTYAVDMASRDLRPGDAAVVIGGANSAGQAALTLSEERHHVFLVSRSPLEAGMARYLRDRIASDPLIEVLASHEVRELGGDGGLDQVTVEDTATGGLRTLPARAMVVLIGAQPPTEWLSGQLALDQEGFILTGPGLGTGLGQREPWRTLAREPFLVETSRPGVFAVGDVRSGSTKMVAPATGDGGMAVRFAAQHLARTSPR